MASIKRETVIELENLTGQLLSLHSEISMLAKKSPNDGINKFKLRFINAVIARSNALLETEFKPFEDFDTFDADDLPTNSDVTMMLAQYSEAMERFRSNHVIRSAATWVYDLPKGENPIRTDPPTRLKPPL